MRTRPELFLQERVSSFIRKHTLVGGMARLLVAVSGGPDSVCLLHILTGLSRELGIALHVAHLNHQLRGAAADADARYVSELAAALELPVTIEKRDVKTYQSRKRLSPEEAAREVRYGFLAEVAQEVGAGAVAVGHTADDHVETILMHLVRGSGTKGLRGLQPSSVWQATDNDLIVIRPLLVVSRKETIAYCAENNLAPRTDTSNLSLSPLRNRIRHELMPLLAGYNPQIEEALLRTARIAGDDIAMLEEYAAAVWEETARREGDTVVLDKQGFLELTPSLQRNLLRVAVEELLGNVMDIELRHIDMIMAALRKPAGRRLDLPSGLTFSIDYNSYYLGRDVSHLCPFPALGPETKLAVPGETRLSGWRVKAAIVSPSAVGTERDRFQAYFDLDRSGNQLSVRARREGDRFRPLGMPQSKKLNKFMIDARIPRPWRQRIPLVCSPDGIAWVVGYRIADTVKITEVTRQVLSLQFNHA